MPADQTKQETRDLLLGRLEAFATENKQDHFDIKKILYGNGKPGIMEQISSMEKDVEAIILQQQTNTKAISDLSKVVSVLNDSVRIHREDKSLHSLLGLSTKKETFIWVLIGFIVFHSVISFIPDINILLVWLGKIVGLPTF